MSDLRRTFSPSTFGGSIPRFTTVGHGASARYVYTDQLLGYINRDIDAWRYQSVENFSVQVLVRPAVNQKPYVSSLGWPVGFQEYNFTAPELEPTDMRVKMDTERRVYVRFEGSWMSVAQYMASLTPAFNDNDQLEGFTPLQMLAKRIQLQSRWWTANGKKFKFSKLPSEIQNRIFEYAIGNDFVSPYPFHHSRGLRLNHLPATKQAIRDQLPNINLMKVSRTLYQDMSHILFNHTTFYVSKLHVLTALLKSTASFRIRKLHIHLSNAEYMLLFSRDLYQSWEVELHGPRELLTEGFETATRLYHHVDLDELTLHFSWDFEPKVDPDRIVIYHAPVKQRLKEAWNFIRVHRNIRVINRRFPGEEAEHLERMETRNARFAEWNEQRLVDGEEEGWLWQYYSDPKVKFKEGYVPSPPRRDFVRSHTSDVEDSLDEEDSWDEEVSSDEDDLSEEEASLDEDDWSDGEDWSDESDSSDDEVVPVEKQLLRAQISSHGEIALWFEEDEHDSSDGEMCSEDEDADEYSSEEEDDDDDDDDDEEPPDEHGSSSNEEDLISFEDKYASDDENFIDLEPGGCPL